MKNRPNNSSFLRSFDCRTGRIVVTKKKKASIQSRNRKRRQFITCVFLSLRIYLLLFMKVITTDGDQLIQWSSLQLALWSHSNQFHRLLFRILFSQAFLRCRRHHRHHRGNKLLVIGWWPVNLHGHWTVSGCLEATGFRGPPWMQTVADKDVTYELLQCVK